MESKISAIPKLKVTLKPKSPYINICNWRLHVEFYQYFLNHIQQNQLLDIIKTQVKWGILGLDLPSSTRRSKQIYGNPGLVYTTPFSSIPAKPWSEFPLLEIIRDKITHVTGQIYTVCVIQRYPSGKCGIKPHRDREMIPGTIIAGLSLGSTRTLKIQRGQQIIPVSLPSGSLYVFYPPTNDYWNHCIDCDDTTEPRWSLTFRNY